MDSFLERVTVDQPLLQQAEEDIMSEYEVPGDAGYDYRTFEQMPRPDIEELKAQIKEDILLVIELRNALAQKDGEIKEAKKQSDELILEMRRECEQKLTFKEKIVTERVEKQERERIINRITEIMRNHKWNCPQQMAAILNYFKSLKEEK